MNSRVSLLQKPDFTGIYAKRPRILRKQFKKFLRLFPPRTVSQFLKLPTRPPRVDHQQQVIDVHAAIAVHIRRIARAAAPIVDHGQQIIDVHDVARTRHISGT
jgi:hypothetical protein